MINNINDIGFNDCTGCSACAIICPNKAIEVKYNNLGFISPIVNNSKCINCGLCKKVCYKYFDPSTVEPQIKNDNISVLAVLNNYFDEMHTVSTIGVANQLSNSFIKQKKKVVGVSFQPNENICEHKIAERENDIINFKGSKYLQSFNYTAFNEIIENDSKSVVFGTPCQIYGLRKIAEHKGIEENILFVDLFCVGVPTSHLWEKYRNFIQRNYKLSSFKTVNFRDKTQGWHKFSIKISDDSEKQYRQNIFNDIFFLFYLKKVCLNKACYNCHFRHDFIFSDIRLGDFWGKKYNIFDDGVGLVLLMTQKGKNEWGKIKQCFRYELCVRKDVYESQKIGAIPLPKEYHGIINSLASKDNLEETNKKFNINTYDYNHS